MSFSLNRICLSSLLKVSCIFIGHHTDFESIWFVLSFVRFVALRCAVQPLPVAHWGIAQYDRINNQRWMLSTEKCWILGKVSNPCQGFLGGEHWIDASRSLLILRREAHQYVRRSIYRQSGLLENMVIPLSNGRACRIMNICNVLNHFDIPPNSFDASAPENTVLCSVRQNANKNLLIKRTAWDGANENKGNRDRFFSRRRIYLLYTTYIRKYMKIDVYRYRSNMKCI